MRGWVQNDDSRARCRSGLGWCGWDDSGKIKLWDAFRWLITNELLASSEVLRGKFGVVREEQVADQPASMRCVLSISMATSRL